MRRRICSNATSAASTDRTRTTETLKPAKEHSADDRTDRPGRRRGLVPDGKPASVRGGDAPPGGGAVAWYRRPALASPALRSPGHPGETRLEAGPGRSRCDPQDRPGGERPRPGDRPGGVDAHVQPGEDVDRGAQRPEQAAAAPAYAGQRRPAVGDNRFRLHEPEPGRARRPGVRLRADQAVRAA